MRMLLGIVAGVFLAGAVWAGSGDVPAGGGMKELFEEMKAQASAEKAFREEKKKAVLDIEAQIDSLRAAAKSTGATDDPATVKPLQTKRLALLEEVAERDVHAAEQSVKFSERRLALAKDNLAAFEQKKAEAEKTLA